MLTCLIKSKQFDESLTFLNGLKPAVRDEFKFEHAYVLHRLGNNKDSLSKLKEMNQDHHSSLRYQHLLSQVNYKLSDYDKSIKTYMNILTSNQEPLEDEDISDILTNYLAC